MGQIDERCENYITVRQASDDDSDIVKCNSTGATPCPGCGMPVCVGCAPAETHDCQKFCTECEEPTSSDINSPMYAEKSQAGTYICHKCAWALKQ